MLKCNSCITEKEKKIREMTYYYNAFYGPYLDFTQTEYKEYIFIKLGRFYSEDAKYANLTRLQILVKLIAEVSEEYPYKEVRLEIWKNSLTIPCDSDAFEISEILIDYILKNVKI